jgi:hypothetical protein
MRLAASVHLAVILLGMSLGTITLVSGCGNEPSGPSADAPNRPVTEDEKQNRMKLMQEQMEKAKARR